MNAWVKGAVSVGSIVAALTAAAACGSDDDRPPAAGGTPGTGARGNGGNGGSAATGSDVDGGGTALNCGGKPCIGEGRICVEGACQCKEGYLREPTPEGDDFMCAVDKSCVKLRRLGHDCRITREGPPAVAAFFAVDYCAGTAVLPDELGDLEQAFEVLEDDSPLQEESKFKILPSDVESYVMIALDVSDTILDNADLLQQTTSELQEFVTSLSDDAGRVTIGLLGFARTVEVLVPFTVDRNKITSMLEALQDNPRAALAPIFDKVQDGRTVQTSFEGTSLMKGLELAIQRTERIQEFRRVVTNNGVLTSGTVVVITDGEDSNGDPVPSILEDTVLSVISVGISDKINGNTLSAIGPDGAFLAPTSQSREEAFAAVSKRVDEHPDRAYLLGYCSGTTNGNHSVTVSVVGKTNQRTAGCQFNADIFGDVPCDPETFAGSCGNAECGGLFACGACADDECCAGGVCVSPSSNPGCNGQDELCQPSGDRCVQDPETQIFSCEPHAGIGDPCVENADCEPGVALCSTGSDGGLMCGSEGVLKYGDRCDDDTGAPMDAAFCESGNCKREKSGIRPRCSDREAHLFEPCSGDLARARCEIGTRCKGSTCALRGPAGLFKCDTGADCAFGFCDPVSKLCVSTGVCHYSWADKLE